MKMKYKNNSILKLALVVVVVALFGACTNDLEQLPIDPNQFTAEIVYQTEEGYDEVMAKVYGGLALTGQEGPAGNGDVGGIDEGTSSFIRNLWNAQVLTTDEAICSWGDFGISQLNNLQYSAANPFIEGLYYRIYHEIAMANEFLRQSTDAKLDSRGQGNLKEKIKVLRAEARFIRAFSYYIAMDVFGNVPFITEDMGLGIYNPDQIMRADLFEWLETEINDFESDLMDANTAPYGRVDKGAAWFLKAKMFLNAEVYTGTSRWADVITETEKVNQAYSFYSTSYKHLFLADNNNKSGSASGFVFSIPLDGDRMQTYGSTTFICFSATGGDIPTASIGLNGGWGGNRTRPETVGRFDSNDMRGMVEPRVRHTYYERDADSPKYDTLKTGPGGIFWDTIEEREISWWIDGTDENQVFTPRDDQTVSKGGSLNIINPGKFTDGFSVMKFRNTYQDGSAPSNMAFVTTDYPMFRLAESYLMYAEATIKSGSGGDINKAVGYVNQLRERAYGNTSGNITQTNLNDQFILDERGRELLWECTRRSDLIRHGQYTSTDYLWQWKGGVENGAAVSVNKRLFAIPAKDIGANPKLKQNPGY